MLRLPGKLDVRAINANGDNVSLGVIDVLMVPTQRNYYTPTNDVPGQLDSAPLFHERYNIVTNSLLVTESNVVSLDAIDATGMPFETITRSVEIERISALFPGPGFWILGRAFSPIDNNVYIGIFAGGTFAVSTLLGFFILKYAERLTIGDFIYDVYAGIVQDDIGTASDFPFIGFDPDAGFPSSNTYTVFISYDLRTYEVVGLYIQQIINDETIPVEVGTVYQQVDVLELDTINYLLVRDDVFFPNTTFFNKLWTAYRLVGVVGGVEPPPQPPIGVEPGIVIVPPTEPPFYPDVEPPDILPTPMLSYVVPTSFEAGTLYIRLTKVNLDGVAVDDNPGNWIQAVQNVDNPLAWSTTMPELLGVFSLEMVYDSAAMPTLVQDYVDVSTGADTVIPITVQAETVTLNGIEMVRGLHLPDGVQLTSTDFASAWNVTLGIAPTLTVDNPLVAGNHVYAAVMALAVLSTTATDYARLNLNADGKFEGLVEKPSDYVGNEPVYFLYSEFTLDRNNTTYVVGGAEHTGGFAANANITGATDGIVTIDGIPFSVLLDSGTDITSTDLNDVVVVDVAEQPFPLPVVDATLTTGNHVYVTVVASADVAPTTAGAYSKLESDNGSYTGIVGKPTVDVSGGARVVALYAADTMLESLTSIVDGIGTSTDFTVDLGTQTIDGIDFAVSATGTINPVDHKLIQLSAYGDDWTIFGVLPATGPSEPIQDSQLQTGDHVYAAMHHTSSTFAPESDYYKLLPIGGGVYRGRMQQPSTQDRRVFVLYSESAFAQNSTYETGNGQTGTMDTGGFFTNNYGPSFYVYSTSPITTLSSADFDNDDWTITLL